MTKDPVCCVDIDEHHARSCGFYFKHQGLTHYFCGIDCHTRFKEDPEQYLAAAAPQWCAAVTVADDSDDSIE